MKGFDTPILFMIFNRPDTTRLVFEEISRVRPTKLFIAADGPRQDKPDDVENCRLTREIVSKIDWPCEVKTLFRDKNLGCRNAPSSAITWFFEHVPEGIILEDDCVPDPTFFRFCTEQLERYRDDQQVMMITGDDFLQDDLRLRSGTSYYFSAIPFIWGWATWKRTWAKYDIEMTRWPEVRDSQTIKNWLDNRAAYEYWERLWNIYHGGVQKTWDWPWAFAIMLNRGLCIIPSTNLVTNIGFGPEATHTKDAGNSLSNMSRRSLDFPLVHPPLIAPDKKTDLRMFHRAFGINSTYLQKIKALPKRIARRLFK